MDYIEDEELEKLYPFFKDQSTAAHVRLFASCSDSSGLKLSDHFDEQVIEQINDAHSRYIEMCREIIGTYLDYNPETIPQGNPYNSGNVCECAHCGGQFTKPIRTAPDGFVIIIRCETCDGLTALNVVPHNGGTYVHTTRYQATINN